MTDDLLVIGGGTAMAKAATRLGLRVTVAADNVPSALLRSVRHVHAASFYLMPDLAAGLAGIFKEAKAAKATTSLTPNDDPTGRWDRITLDPVLRVTDYFLPTATQALALTGHHEVPHAAGILARRGPLVVVRNGPEGSLTHDGFRVIRAPTEDIDPSAVEDGFEARWIAAVLNGSRIEQALAAATGRVTA